MLVGGMCGWVYEVGIGGSMETLGGDEDERNGIRKQLGWRRREERQRVRRSEYVPRLVVK